MSITLHSAYGGGSTAALAALGLTKTALSLSAIERHVDDLGIGLMAAPYAAELVGSGLSHSQNKKMKSFGHKIKKSIGMNSAFGRSHARELLGLALVAPSINKLVSKGVHKSFKKLPKFKFPKLGMQLDFDTPQQQAQHQATRNTIGDVAGFGGSIVGGIAGGAAGSAAGGPAGGIAGNLAGGYLGQNLAAKPVQLAYDIKHDVQQRTGARYNQTMGQLNQAAGLPAGGRM
jgi:hypothetical protein